MMQRRRHEDVLLDAVAAALTALLGVSSLFRSSPGDRPADALGVVLVVLGAMSLVLTRRLPLPVLAITLATTMTVHGLGYDQNGAGLTVLWALYVVASRLPLRVSAAAAVATLALVNVSLATAPDTGNTADRISTSVIMGAGWAFGRASRARRSKRDLEDRAVVAEERAAIAREMQDLLAHELAELSVQVTAAQRLATQDPDATRAILADAEHTARAVVGEGRRILALLTPAGETNDRRPLPGLGDLPELAQRLAEAGISVEVQADGASEVAAGPGLLAYRAAEETLADAMSGRASHASVVVDGDGGALRLTIRHDGQVGTASTTRPSGIRRRAQLYGGRVVRRNDSGATTVVLEIPATGTRRATR